MRKSASSILRCVTIFGIIAVASGCAHPLVVRNIDTYRVSMSTAQTTKQSIGVVPTSASYDDQIILNGVADSLRRYSREVIVPYAKGGERKVDIVANVDLHSQYDGSGVNFLIDWPGFIIWTPAWNGYVYNIKHNFNIRLEDGKSESTLDTINVPVSLDVRHAAMNRTWLAESGWWLLWSVPSFIGGFFHIEYDSNVTPLEAKEIAAPLGDYVAQEIIRRINADATKVVEKPAPRVEPKTSLEDSLRELNKLKENKLITQEEFDAKKKSLLEKY